MHPVGSRLGIRAGSFCLTPMMPRDWRDVVGMLSEAIVIGDAPVAVKPLIAERIG